MHFFNGSSRKKTESRTQYPFSSSSLWVWKYPNFSYALMNDLPYLQPQIWELKERQFWHFWSTRQVVSTDKRWHLFRCTSPGQMGWYETVFTFRSRWMLFLRHRKTKFVNICIPLKTISTVYPLLHHSVRTSLGITLRQRDQQHTNSSKSTLNLSITVWLRNHRNPNPQTKKNLREKNLKKFFELPSHFRELVSKV